MRRLTPGRGPSSRLGQRYAVEEPQSQKLHSLSRCRTQSCASSIPARRIQTGCPMEKPIPKTGTKENKPTRRRIDNRATPREKGGLEGIPKMAYFRARWKYFQECWRHAQHHWVATVIATCAIAYSTWTEYVEPFVDVPEFLEPLGSATFFPPLFHEPVHGSESRLPA